MTAINSITPNLNDLIQFDSVFRLLHHGFYFFNPEDICHLSLNPKNRFRVEMEFSGMEKMKYVYMSILVGEHDFMVTSMVNNFPIYMFNYIFLRHIM